MHRSRTSLVAGVLAAGFAGGAVFASGESSTTYDDYTDAVVRRTDPGNDGPINGLSLLPDLRDVTLTGWLPDDAVNDPYTGQMTDPKSADLLRLDVRLEGLVNPPGTLGLGAQAFAPYAFGPSPVFGFVEFDVDRNRDTGGELTSGAMLRYPANVGRFATVPEGSSADRIARCGDDLDFDFNSAPQFERSGQDYALVLCGCFEVSIVNDFGDGDGSFDAGDTWIVSGRFFQRAGGFEAASAVYGGSFFGLYDPVVELLFTHDVPTDVTTVSLVYPLTMAGAAMLCGEAVQPIDLSVSNHTSVEEALDDIIIGAGGPLSDPAWTLVHEWAYETAQDHLDVTRWRVTAVVGTTYSTPEQTLYVWSDVLGDHEVGDYDGSGFVQQNDRDAVSAFIAAEDGGAGDVDGIVNGVVTLADAAVGFSAFDVNGDGLVDGVDVALVPVLCDGDADGDGAVTVADLTYVIFRLGNAGDPGEVDGDADLNGVVDVADITYVIFRLGTVCS